MRTIAILPMKSFGSAKQRLSARLRADSREALARAMFCDVLDALAATAGLEEIAVVSADEGAAAEARARGMRVVPDEAQAGQSAAAASGVRLAVADGYDRALLVPGDTPLLDPGQVDDLLARAETDGTAVVIVPDRHGTGTNALLLSPPDVLEPAFGPGSLERHRARAAALSHRVEAVGSLALDLDTPEDFTLLAERLRSGGPRARRTRQLLVDEPASARPAQVRA